MRFEVKFYETTDGKKPVEDFLLSLENSSLQLFEAQ